MALRSVKISQQKLFSTISTSRGRTYVSGHFFPKFLHRSILIRTIRVSFLRPKSSSRVFNLIFLHHNRPYLTFEQIRHFAPVIKMFVIDVNSQQATIGSEFRSIFVGESDKFTRLPYNQKRTF